MFHFVARCAFLRRRGITEATETRRHRGEIGCEGGVRKTVIEAACGCIWLHCVGSGGRRGEVLPSPLPSPSRVEGCARWGRWGRGRAREDGSWFAIGVSL